MKALRFIILIIFLSLFWVSCKTHEKISVIVIDKLTKQPIDSVFVKVSDGKKNGGDWSDNAVTGYTDSNGKFEATINIGYAFGNNHIYLGYEKKGYIYKEELNKTEGIVELEH
ncbi:MAG: hypothetical protein M0R21_04320 [Lentimicrobiaceae bacterium]|nr:hypothetical protein [Lentimicrobiaceae bacterium]